MKKATVISVIGSGGKTTCIERIAREVKRRGKRAAIVTTTHMWIPERNSVVGKTWEEAAEVLDKEGMVYFGAEAETKGKMVFPGEEGYKALCRRAHVMLVEADGAKRKPMKLPDWSREPVIPGNTDGILLVFGLSALGKSLEEVCHRWELGLEVLEEGDNGEKEIRGEVRDSRKRRAKEVRRENKENGKGNEGKKEEIKCRIVDKEMACLFLEKGYLEELRRRFSAVPVIVLLNQADNKERRKAGEWMKERLEREKVMCRILQLGEEKHDSYFGDLHGIGFWEKIWEE